MILVLRVKCSTTVLLIHNYPIPHFPHFLSPSACAGFEPMILELRVKCFASVLLMFNCPINLFCHFSLTQYEWQDSNP
jgi:hypothetical protein